MPDVVGVDVPVWSSYASSRPRVRVVLAVGEPEVLVFVFEVSDRLDSEVLVPDVDTELVFDVSGVFVFDVSGVCVFDVSEVFAFDVSAVLAFEVPLMPDRESDCLPSATLGSVTAIGIIARIAAAAVASPVRFQFTTRTPLGSAHHQTRRFSAQTPRAYGREFNHRMRAAVTGKGLKTRSTRGAPSGFRTSALNQELLHEDDFAGKHALSL